MYKNVPLFQNMSLVSLTLYIMIIIRKNWTKKSKNAYQFKIVYVPGLFDSFKTKS